MIRAGRFLLVAGMLTLLAVSPARAQDASVKAILFYDPGLDACKTLINEILPPLLKQHDRSLLIFAVDITNPEGRKLYESALSSQAIPQDQQGVPLLILHDTYLSGLDSLQSRLPQQIDQGLAQGGTDWPSIPGLEDALWKAGFTQPPSNPWEKFIADQPSNTLAVIVLAGLFLSLVFSILITFRTTPKFLLSIPAWVFPVLLGIGIVVASYLAYIEGTQTEIFCGGISHCQEVQDSAYSKILGLITIGEFGIIGYSLIGLAWLVHRSARGMSKTIAAIAMFGFAVFGVSFSMYLTFLEPFVIGATCLWCLASAAIMGLILPLTTDPVRTAIQPYTQTGPDPASGG